MSAPDRRQLVDRRHGSLSIRRQCDLLGIARSGLYRRAPAANDNDLAVMRRLDELCDLGRPLLVGLSRKSSLARLVGGDRVASAAVSVGAAVAAYDRGATILRVHDVRDHVEALAAARAVRE